MTDDERKKMGDWVNNWKETGKLLESLRREEIRNANLSEVLPIFDDALRSALWLSPAKSSSGLVEFHRLLAKTR